MEESKSSGGFNGYSFTCPCCRKDFRVDKFVLIPADFFNPGNAVFIIKCPQCGLKTDSYSSQEQAAEAWKNREFANWTESAKAFYRKK